MAAPAPLFIVFHSRGNWADCIATHRIALASARAAGNRQGEAWVLSNLGDALGVTGQSEAIGQLELSRRSCVTSGTGGARRKRRTIWPTPTSG